MGIQRQPCCCRHAIMRGGDYAADYTGPTFRFYDVDLESGYCQAISPMMPPDSTHSYFGAYAPGPGGQMYIIGGSYTLLPNGANQPISQLCKVDITTGQVTDVGPFQYLNTPTPNPPYTPWYLSAGFALNYLGGAFYQTGYDRIQPLYFNQPAHWYLVPIDPTTGAMSVRQTEIAPVVAHVRPDANGKYFGGAFFIAFTTGPDGALYGSLMYREYSTDPDYDNIFGIPTTELWRINTTTGVGTKVRTFTEFDGQRRTDTIHGVYPTYDPKSGTWWATYRTFFRECPVSIWQTEDAINGTFRKVVPALHGEVYADLSHGQLVF